MNKNILSAIIVTSGILISGAIIGFANAETINPGAQIEPSSQPQGQQALADIQFPIKELGDCKSKEGCKNYCNNSEHADACLAFAEQHHLMSSDEVTVAKKFQDKGMAGPGGCKGKAECEQYCENSDHLEECVTFAQKNGLLSPQQEQDSKKVLAAMKKGIKPPACAGPKQCDAYCGSAAHMEECMNFSLAAGLVPDNQKDQMQKMLNAIKQGIKPPACNGPQECDQYCSDPAHIEECMNFSLAAGLVPEGDKAQVQKTFDAIKKGIKPLACQPNSPNQSGGPNEGQGFKPGFGQNGNGNGQSQGNQSGQSNQSVQGRQSCDQYCADSNHVEECVKFSVAVGNMTEQQAQVAIKTGGKGPGGCVGREACDAFCGNPDNQETCFNFGKENGMIPEEDLQKMQEGQQKMKDSFNKIPAEVLDCLTSSVGADVVEKMKTGLVIQRKDGDSINQCFQKFSIQERRPNQNQSGESGQFNQQGQRGGGPNAEQGFNPGPGQNVNDQDRGQGNQSGPGRTNFGNQRMPEQAGPGGCKGPEECRKYCTSNPEVCKNFQPQQNQQGQFNHPEQGEDRGAGGPGISGGSTGPCGTGPGTCSGQGHDDRNFNKDNGGRNGGGHNEGEGFNPGSGQNGNGPGQGNRPWQQGQFNQPGQMQPQQPMQFQGGQRGQMPPDQPGQFNQPNSMQFQQQQNQMMPQGGGSGSQPNFLPPQSEQQSQPSAQQQTQQPPPIQPASPSSFFEQAQKLMGSVFNVFILK